MNARQYDKMMQEQIENGKGKKLLLHCCCAPCSSAVLERLHESFEICTFFYNPNICGDEYLRRKEELKKLLKKTGWAKFIDCDHEEEKFYEAAKGLENCKEGGLRCEKCFRLRLEKTAAAADEGGFDYFGTTLTISPLKNADLINKIGESLTSNAEWLYSDFKKRDGYLRSIRLSEEFGLYRQDFCGCVFSKNAKNS